MTCAAFGNRYVAAVVCATIMVSWTAAATAQDSKKGDSDRKWYSAQIGPDSEKIKVEGDKTYIYAGINPKTKITEWYDFTGSPIPAGDLQYGIGKDRIPSIDDPLFVSPDDPRLRGFSPSRRRPKEGANTNDGIRVIGYVVNGDARAYPTSLLNRHELVNDRVGGKPVTVGW